MSHMQEILHLLSYLLSHCFPTDQFSLAAFFFLLFIHYTKVRVKGQGIKETAPM